MAPARTFHPQPANRLLDQLPPDERARLLSLMTPVPLAYNAVVQQARKPAEYAYFPTSGVLSALTVMEDGKAIEVGNVGNEGVTPAAALLGVQVAPNQHIVQIAGEALRVKADVLAREVDRDGPLRRLLTGYQSYFHLQVSQSVACNGLHSVQQRCCRWLLLTHDRVAGDDLPLTQEFLAMMLGVRRPSVTVVLQPLQDQGLIRTARGKVRVLDRGGLEVACCECYQVVRDEYDRLLA